MNESALSVVVIGVGNLDRADDGVGILVAREVERRAGRSVRVVEERGEVSRLMEAWEGADVAFLVDAMVSNREAGAIHVFEAHEHRMKADVFCCSTHAMGLLEAMELSRALAQFPGQMIVCGVEGKRFEAGATMSPEVERAIPELVEIICTRLNLIAEYAGIGGTDHA